MSVVAVTGSGPWDRMPAITAASYLVGINLLLVNTQPIIMGALADAYHLTDANIGQINAMYIGAITLATLSAPLWVRAVNWQVCSVVSVLGSVLALGLGAALRDIAAIMFLFATLGFLKGVVGAPSFASLGDASNPDRAYGVSVAFQAILAAIVAWPMSALIVPRFGVPGAFLALAALVATALIACFWLPRRGRVQPSRAERAATRPLNAAALIPAVLALVALFLFNICILGFWYFVERIGVARGVPNDLIGLTVSCAALAGVATAGLVGWLGGRVATIAILTAGAIAIIASFLLLELQGAAPYIAANILFSSGWGLGQPSLWAILRRVDVTDRLFVIAPVSSGSAGVVIGIAAGPIIEAGGYSLLLATAGAAQIAAVALALVASTMGERVARRGAVINPSID